MAAVPTPIENCLPNFIEGGAVVPWKRKLFYMLGYCDTYHDFHGSRLGDSKQGGDRGDIVRLVKTIGSLSDFSIKLINEIDPDFEWKMTVYDIIQSGMGGSKKYSFENAMFNTFTKTIATPAAAPPAPLNRNLLAQKMTPEGFGQEYMKYLHETLKIRQDQILDTQVLELKDFTDGVPEAYSSIIELEMPAILKTKPEKISENLYKFIEKNYPMRIVKDGVSKIPFVEDAASFPRSIFQGYNGNQQANAFLKIETPQTLWDPAGLSVYLEHEKTKKQTNIAAPSFLAKQPYSEAETNAFDGSAYFNGTNDTLVLPANTLPIKSVPANTFNLQKYSGPSVNHLVLHMILNTPGVITDVNQRKQLETLINASTLAKKSSNYTFKVDVGPNDGDKKQRLRNYTSSKRSGDYENIHSAMVHNAIMFTGDEPAFLYGVMNRCPMIYHIKSEIRHTFRFYIPPPPGEVAVVIEDTRKQLRDYVHTATELLTLFGISLDAYKTMVEDVKNKVEGKITVTGNATYGERLGTILKGALVKNIQSIHTTLQDIAKFKNIEKMLLPASKLFITIINQKLTALGTINDVDIDNEPGKTNFKELQSSIDAAVLDIKTNIDDAETHLSGMRDLIPRKFKGSKTQTYQFFNLFETVDGAQRRQSCFSIGGVFYKLGETKILPDLPKTFNQAFKKLAQIASNIERGGRRGGGYDFYADNIKGIREILTELQCDENVIKLFKEGSEFPTTPNDIQTKYDFIEHIKDIVGLFAPVAGQAGGRVVVDRPINQYNLIQSKFNKTYKNSKITEVRQNKTRRNKIYNQTIQTNILTKQIPEPSTNYETLYADILEQATRADIQPFGLTPEEYAASIVYRCILVDKLHAFFYPSSQTVVALEPIIDITPVQLDTTQMVGGAIQDNEADYTIYLLNEVLSPFWQKYFVREPGDPQFINTVYSNSFLPDYIDLLDEIIATPADSFTKGTAFSGEVDQAIEAAVAAKNILINLKGVDSTKMRIQYRKAAGDITKNTIQGYLSQYYTKTTNNVGGKDVITVKPLLPVHSEFTTIKETILFFQNMFVIVEPPPAKPFREQDALEEILYANPEPEDNDTLKKAQNEYLHFYFKAYLDTMFSVDPNPPPPGAAGGSRKTRRRARATKQRKSKRRVPRRKRNNK